MDDEARAREVLRGIGALSHVHNLAEAQVSDLAAVLREEREAGRREGAEGMRARAVEACIQRASVMERDHGGQTLEAEGLRDVAPLLALLPLDGAGEGEG